MSAMGSKLISEKAQDVTVLMADDDPECCELAMMAWQDTDFTPDFHTVQDGKELLDYLQKRGAYDDETKNPTPSLILLDLNMPRVSGKEALQQIKSDPTLRQIPVVILTTSSYEGDVKQCYDLGANSYITKPTCFEDLLEVLSQLNDYWFGIVSIPKNRVSEHA